MITDTVMFSSMITDSVDPMMEEKVKSNYIYPRGVKYLKEEKFKVSKIH